VKARLVVKATYTHAAHEEGDAKTSSSSSSETIEELYIA